MSLEPWDTDHAAPNDEWVDEPTSDSGGWDASPDDIADVPVAARRGLRWALVVVAVGVVVSAAIGLSRVAGEFGLVRPACRRGHPGHTVPHAGGVARCLAVPVGRADAVTHHYP